MGASTLEFKGKSMDYRDPEMEVILRLLIQEIDKEKLLPTWLKEAREDWNIVSTEEFGFGVIPELKDFLIDEERCSIIRNFAFKALEKLKSFGDPIPAKILNTLGAGQPTSEFTQDVEAKIFIETFEDFIELLQ